MKTNARPALSKSKVDTMAVFFSTCFFLSLLLENAMCRLPFGRFGDLLKERRRTGAGLVGSLAGLVTYLALPLFIAQSGFSIMIGLLFSVVVSGRAERFFGVKDDSRIVIDEWIGMWVTLWGWGTNVDMTLLIPIGFFRLFDVVKGPWGKLLQRLPGGWGINLDDVVAGLLANISWRILLTVFLPLTR